MRVTKAFLVAAALLAASFASTARAAAAPDAETAATALIEQAARAYDQNQLDEALELLTRAYGLSARPSILYNQAQVLRAKDDCAGALDAYRHFLETTTPDDPNRERALHRRDEMQACADQRAAATAPPKLTPPPPAAAASPPPAVLVRTPAPTDRPEGDHPSGHRRAMRAAGWTLVGAGVLAAGAAAVLAWEAHDKQAELTQDLRKMVHPEWTEHEKSLYDDGPRYATAARWCGAIAAAAGAGGAALLIIARPPATGGSAAANTAFPATLIGWSGNF